MQKLSQTNKPSYTTEQEQAIYESGHNILVSASAGSGKTMVLVERIMNIIQSGTDITELLVVTFTKAAAQEMKERIQFKIQDRINELPSSSQEKKHLIKQLPLIGQANISTIHSFCTKVIKKYYYLIDIDPVFRMITDETEIEMIKEEVLDQCIELKLEDENPSFVKFLEMYSGNGKLDNVKKLILDTYQFALSKPDYMDWIESLDEPYKVENLKELAIYHSEIKPDIINTLETNISRSKNIIEMVEGIGELEKYKEVYSELINEFKFLIELIKDDRISDFYSAIDTFKYPPKPRVSKKWEQEIIDLDNELNTVHKESIKNDLDKMFNRYFLYSPELQLEQLNKLAPVVSSLIEIIKEFHIKFTERKLAQQSLDFNDLEHKTLDILTNEISVAADYYKNQFKEILIDEYQDINLLQETILSSVSNTTIGNRFMVGDVKQSIYGFRLAEPQLFIDKYNRFAESSDDSRIVLQKNFRSRDSVLNFINFIFNQLMDEEVGEIIYDSAAQLNVGNTRFPEDNTKRTELLIYESKGTDNEDVTFEEAKRIQSSYEGESKLVAQKIRQLIDSNYQVYDKKADKMRDIQYSDIVLLTPTKLNNLLIQQEFHLYNIPVSMDSTENYFQRTEIMTMMSLLKIIDNPLQDIPLVAVLRSPIVGLIEPELAEIRLNNRKDNYYQALLDYSVSDHSDINTKLQKRIHDFLTKLDEWRNYSKFNSLVDLIWKLYNDTHYLEYVGGLRLGSQRQNNLHALYERAANYEESSFKGLFQFIKLIERMQKKEKDLAEPSKVTDQDNAVRVMTIHKSKGLEFPVVFLCNASKKFNVQDAQGTYTIDNDEGFGSDYVDTFENVKYPTWVNSAVKQKRLGKLISEQLRVLYVALTRAEQKLFISGTAESKDNLISSWLPIQNHRDQTLPTIERLSFMGGFLDLIGKSLIRHPLMKEYRLTSDSIALAFQDIDFEFIFKNEDELISEELETLNYHSQSAEDEPVLSHSSKQVSDTFNQLKTIIEFQYPHKQATQTTSFQSVSEIKRFFEEPEDERVVKINISDTGVKPSRFVSDDLDSPRFKVGQVNTVTSADIGSATHLILQRVDFTKPILRETINELIIHLVKDQVIEENVANQIDLERLMQFAQSELGQFIQENALALKREAPFSLLIEANMLFEQITHSDDQLLIHGIIDGYIIKDNNITLFDYKTDRVSHFENPEKVLIDRYKGQLNMYKLALQTIYPNHHVEGVYIYSLDLNKSIKF